MKIVKDRDAIWDTDDFDVVLLATNIYNRLVNGLQYKMRCKYPVLEAANDCTKFGDRKKLGTNNVVKVSDKTEVCMMYTCTHPGTNKEYVKYEALEKCMRLASLQFKGKRIMTTICGASRFDGSGDKDRILDLMGTIFGDEDVTVYDYEQRDKNDETKSVMNRIRENGLTGQRKEIMRKLYLMDD